MIFLGRFGHLRGVGDVLVEIKVPKQALYFVAHKSGQVIACTANSTKREAIKAYQDLMREYLPNLPSFEWDDLRVSRELKVLRIHFETAIYDDRSGQCLDGSEDENQTENRTSND